MSEESKRYMNLTLEKDKIEFICEIGNKPLKECVEEDIQKYHINKKQSQLINEEILNCLKAMLVTCVGEELINFNANTPQLKILVQDLNENQMEIIELELTISLDHENELLINKINECLRLFNVSCIKNREVIFSVNFEKKSGLGKYKNDLLKIKEELEDILGREIPMD